MPEERPGLTENGRALGFWVSKRSAIEQVDFFILKDAYVDIVEGSENGEFKLRPQPGKTLRPSKGHSQIAR